LNFLNFISKIKNPSNRKKKTGRRQVSEPLRKRPTGPINTKEKKAPQ
jgi:hypothetical protein